MSSITWLGHAAFVVTSANGKKIYVDPWLTGNPRAPEGIGKPTQVDVIALTHGHGDHVGDTVGLSETFPEAQIVCQYELKAWLGNKGANVGEVPGLNKGGSTEIDGIRFTLTNAFHSSSGADGEYLGEACGIVIRLEDGKTIYFSGDTCVFGDMALLARIYKPTHAVLPIGDNFTMGPDEAAVALELLGNPVCVPSHWGTFPLLTGTPDRLAELKPDATIVRIEPGQSVDL